MADPFAHKPAGGAFERLLGGGRTVAEIEAVLAGAVRLREVSPETVEQIAKRHGIDLGRRLAGPRRNLYRRFLEHCLVDCALSPEENVDLAHLQRLLRLADADAARIHDEVAQAVYGRAVAEVLSDLQLDPEERSFLERIGADLALSPQVTAQIYEKGAGPEPRPLPDAGAHAPECSAGLADGDARSSRQLGEVARGRDPRGACGSGTRASGARRCAAERGPDRRARGARGALARGARERTERKP